MAKIPTYPSLTTPDNDDELIIEDSNSNSTKKITRGNLISGSPLPAGTVDTQSIENDAITTAKILDAAVTVAKRSGGFFISHFSNTATGSRSFTGVGFQPKLVVFFYRPPASNSTSSGGYGAATDLSQLAVAWSGSTSATARQSSTTACFMAVPSTSSTPTDSAAFTSMDADGFTINVTAQAGLSFTYIAFG